MGLITTHGFVPSGWAREDPWACVIRCEGRSCQGWLRHTVRRTFSWCCFNSVKTQIISADSSHPHCGKSVREDFLMINGLRVPSRASGGKVTFSWGYSKYGMPMMHWNLCLSEALEKPNTHCVIICINETPLCGSKLFSEGNHMQIYIFKNPPLVIRKTR